MGKFFSLASLWRVKIQHGTLKIEDVDSIYILKCIDVQMNNCVLAIWGFRYVVVTRTTRIMDISGLFVNIYRASTNSIGKYIRLGYSPTQDASVRERKAQGPRRLNLHANPRNYSIWNNKQTPSFNLMETNIAGWNITIFTRKYIFNPGPCSSQLR